LFPANISILFRYFFFKKIQGGSVTQKCNLKVFLMAKIRIKLDFKNSNVKINPHEIVTVMPVLSKL